MKLKVVTVQKTEVGTINLPDQFQEAVRPDLIKRAVLSLQSGARQPYGAMPGAGQRHSAKLSKRRRKYRGSYGFGISRIPRKILSRRGTRMNWTGAIVPGTVGGRRAHPPKAFKNWDLKINQKEYFKALRSSLAASINPDFVRARGHKPCADFPFIVEDKLESVAKAKEIRASLEKMNFKEELERLSPKIRAGRGKIRGRRKAQPVGPLLVVSKQCPLIKAAANLPGVDVVEVKELDVELLAPGTHPGRLTLFTKSAIELLEKQALFTDDYHPEEHKDTNAPIVEEKPVEKTKKPAQKRTAAKVAAKKKSEVKG